MEGNNVADFWIAFWSGLSSGMLSGLFTGLIVGLVIWWLQEKRKGATDESSALAMYLGSQAEVLTAIHQSPKLASPDPKGALPINLVATFGALDYMMLKVYSKNISEPPRTLGSLKMHSEAYNAFIVAASKLEGVLRLFYDSTESKWFPVALPSYEPFIIANIVSADRSDFRQPLGEPPNELQGAVDAFRRMPEAARVIPEYLAKRALLLDRFREVKAAFGA